MVYVQMKSSSRPVEVLIDFRCQRYTVYNLVQAIRYLFFGDSHLWGFCPSEQTLRGATEPMVSSNVSFKVQLQLNEAVRASLSMAAASSTRSKAMTIKLSAGEVFK